MTYRFFERGKGVFRPLARIWSVGKRFVSADGDVMVRYVTWHDARMGQEMMLGHIL